MTGGQPTDGEASSLEVSVLMPCLNEAETLEACVTKAKRALREHNIAGEIIVADNGSTDGSQDIAKRLGARLVHVEDRGYGSAITGGVASARGKFIIMGDADDSYDFLEISRFVEKLREGFDLVQGCRLPTGGGRIMPGAMPFLHRWWGNPMLSFMVRHMFSVPVNDVYCGMRGFTKEFFDRLDLRCTGMEFATEMIIKCSIHGGTMAEIPVILHCDGRKSHPSHLKTFRDGWRTLRFFLLYSPEWLFLYPGVFLILLGLFGYSIAMPGLTISGVTFDVHTLLFASLAILLGFQSVLFAIFAKTFAVSEGLLPPDRRLTLFHRFINLEKGLIVGCSALLFGLLLLLTAVNLWRLQNFGQLNYPQTMRWVIPGVTLTALGFQTLLSSFFVSLLTMRRQ